MIVCGGMFEPAQWVMSLSEQGSRGGSRGATGASAPVPMSLDPPVAPLTGSLH